MNSLNMSQLMKIFECKSRVGEESDSMNQRLINRFSWNSQRNGNSARLSPENQGRSDYLFFDKIMQISFAVQDYAATTLISGLWQSSTCSHLNYLETGKIWLVDFTFCPHCLFPSFILPTLLSSTQSPKMFFQDLVSLCCRILI